jgi:hypothetical protein
MTQSGFRLDLFLLECVGQVCKMGIEPKLNSMLGTQGLPFWDGCLKEIAEAKLHEMGVSSQPIGPVDFARYAGILGPDPNVIDVENPGEVTDRAYRYRAQNTPPPGQPICAFCGSTRSVQIGHVDGHEENGEADNLVWTCRSCNSVMGVVFKREGVGRRTRQYNPGRGSGAQTLGQWMNAVMSMKGEGDMSVPDAVSLVHDTPPARRSRFAKEIWRLRRQRGTDRGRS